MGVPMLGGAGSPVLKFSPFNPVPPIPTKFSTQFCEAAVKFVNKEFDIYESGLKDLMRSFCLNKMKARSLPRLQNTTAIELMFPWFFFVLDLEICARLVPTVNG